MALPPVSFLFIVNELPTNDDPDDRGSISPRRVHGRWHPPEWAQGFLAQRPGNVYRWTDGNITLASNYAWDPRPVDGYANGAIWATTTTDDIVWPRYYRAATVFYCNNFDKFFTTQGDASTRDIATADPEYQWQPLTFLHQNNNSHVEYAGDQEHLAVTEASWINQLMPNVYRRDESIEGPNFGGLSGILSIVIALVAFSCRAQDLDNVLRTQRAWRGRRWVPHNRRSGRK
jgi:hypothetical protein